VKGGCLNVGEVIQVEKMGDEGMDPCECIWGHEMAMRRLLSLLRQSQSYCTDTECFEDVAGPQTRNQGENFFFMALICVFAIALVILRPRNMLRGQIDDNSKPSSGSGNEDGSSGSPPPTAF